MSNIEQLEERIAQLTELVKSGRETIKSMEAALRAAEEERDRLADQRRENEPKFEIAQGENYYFVNFYDRGCNLNVTSDVYVNAFGDRARVDQNNCFTTEERAKEVLDKIKFLLKLERLHDIYCPDYKAEDDGNDKYRIVFCDGMYQWEQDNYTVDFLSVYFPTEEIAQKVCAILNKESNL